MGPGRSALLCRMPVVVVACVLASAARGAETAAETPASSPSWRLAPVPAEAPPSSPRAFDTPSAATDPSVPPGVARLDPKMDLAFDLVTFTHGDLDGALRTTPEASGFVLRRARLGLAWASGDWEARFDQEIAAAAPAVVAPDPLFPLGPTAPAPRPVEAYAAYAPSAALRVTAGIQRVPLSWARLMDPADQWLGQAPWPVQRMLPDVRLGLSVGGDLGLLQYALAWFGPAADAVERFGHEGNLWVFRLSGEPLGPVGQAPWRRPSGDPWTPWWRFGHALSFAWAHLPDAGTNVLIATFDQSFAWRRVSFMGELAWQRRTPTVSRAVAIDALAAWADAGFALAPDRWSLIGRFDWMNGDLGTREATDSWGVAGGTEVALASPITGPRVFLRLVGERRWQRFGPGAADTVRLGFVLAR